MNLGSYIYYLRKKNKISQRELGKLADISAIYISEIENGHKRNPSFEVLSSLATALSLTECELYTLFDLHAKLNNCTSYDVGKYVMNNEIVRGAIREAKKYNASNDDWEKFKNKVNAKKGD